jgi:surface protein
MSFNNIGIYQSNINKYNICTTLFLGKKFLPREMVENISDFISKKNIFTPLTNEDLYKAVNMYYDNNKEAISIYGEIGTWDVSNITSMKGLFSRKYLLNSKFIGISKWNVGNVTDMSEMFMYSIFESNNISISKWNVSNVTNMSKMFYYCSFNNDISNWNISKVKNMSEMFFSSMFNGNISKWDVSNVTNMYGIFMYSVFDGDISNWDVSNVEY